MGADIGFSRALQAESPTQDMSERMPERQLALNQSTSDILFDQGMILSQLGEGAIPEQVRTAVTNVSHGGVQCWREHDSDDHDRGPHSRQLRVLCSMRQEVLEHALIPGVLDALGGQEGQALLQAELPQLEAEAQRAARNLGVDLQQPLLNAIRAL